MGPLARSCSAPPPYLHWMRAEVPARPLGEGLLCTTLMLLICNLQALCFSVFLPPPPPLTLLSLILFFCLSSSISPICFSHSSLFAPPPPFFTALNPCVEEGGSLGTKYVFIIQALHIKRIISASLGMTLCFTGNPVLRQQPVFNFIKDAQFSTESRQVPELLARTTL